MPIAVATPRDLPYVIDLAKKEGHALGFLPRQCVENCIDVGRVLMARENGDACGFFLSSTAQKRLRIYQAAVQYDARGLAHGIELLAATIIQGIQAGTTHITLHCRDGLESNTFWSATGFKRDGIITGGHSKKRLIHCWRLDIADALTDPSLPYATRFLSAIRQGPPESQSEVAAEMQASQRKGRAIAGWGTTGDRRRAASSPLDAVL